MISHRDLHHALATEIVEKHAIGGVSYMRVRLQHSKNEITHSLHAAQTTFNISGHITEAHVLHRLGFSQGQCAFVSGGQCLAKDIPDNFDLHAFASDIANIMGILRGSLDDLQACGFFVEQSLFGAGGISPIVKEMLKSTSDDGHNVSKKQEMKKSEDNSFEFVFTFIETEREKGWVTHYIPKHKPVSEELSSMLSFLGLRLFSECPEASFDPCFWRFFRYIPDGNRNIFHGPTETAHKWFDAHASHFSEGISKILSAEAIISKYDLYLLPNVKTNVPAEIFQPPQNRRRDIHSSNSVSIEKPSPVESFYDLAISFAGAQRELAEIVANRVRDAGLAVFYDRFYPEQLWGKDLSVFFDEIFRKKARYCLIFVSNEYIERDWTNYERRSAVARMIELKGQEYILPVKVHDVELPGVQPTIGYVSLKDFSVEQISDMVLAKLQSDL